MIRKLHQEVLLKKKNTLEVKVKYKGIRVSDPLPLHLSNTGKKVSCVESLFSLRTENFLRPKKVWRYICHCKTTPPPNHLTD